MSVTSRRGVAAVPHRVIQWGTGNTGAHTLRFLLEDPAFHVVGVWVKREQNIGRTAGELAGLGVAGGRAAETNSADPLISDPYGYTPTVSAVTQGSQGSVAYAGDEITYTYGQEVAGQHAYFDSYTYTVTDGHGSTATATVSIKMVVLNPG